MSEVMLVIAGMFIGLLIGVPLGIAMKIHIDKMEKEDEAT